MSNDAVIAAFTEMAADYERTVDNELRWFWGVGYRDFVARFLGPIRLQGHERVLDIGTGMAVVPSMLLGHATWRGHVVGVDITPEMLKGARKTIERTSGSPRVRLVCGSGMVLPFEDGTFDTVTCALATHHMQVPALLKEIRRVLRPNGQLLIGDVGLADFWQSRFGRVWIGLIATVYSLSQGKMRVQAELEGMKNMHAPESWHSMLLAAGFEQVRAEVLQATRRWYPPGLMMQALAH